MTATAAEYAALAAKQVGKRYVLGQPVPYKGGNPAAFDCSGLIIWLNNQTGAFPMGDDTAAGLYNRSKAVKGEPAVGDMVFLRNNPARSNGIGHVAVLTAKLSNGDWRIIEARGKASGVVATTLSYWRTRKYYAGIRRLPGFKLASAAPKPTPARWTPSTSLPRRWAMTRPSHPRSPPRWATASAPTPPPRASTAPSRRTHLCGAAGSACSQCRPCQQR